MNASFRLIDRSELDEVMDIVSDVVPIMQSQGLIQWNEEYPNREVFEADIVRGSLFGLYEDLLLQGFCAIVKEDDEEYAQIPWMQNGDAAVVHRLAVHSRAQGKGYARKLLKQAEIFALEKEFDLLRTDTHETNQTMQYLLSPVGHQRIPGLFSMDRDPKLGLFIAYEKRLEKE